MISAGCGNFHPAPKEVCPRKFIKSSHEKFVPENTGMPNHSDHEPMNRTVVVLGWRRTSHPADKHPSSSTEEGVEKTVGRKEAMQ